MPRLRHLKKFEQIGDNSYEKETTEIEGSKELYNTEPEQRYDDLSGRSWWSNSNIITSLSDIKIKQAITYHKQMAKTLENELCARSAGVRKFEPFIVQKISNSSTNIFNITSKKTKYSSGIKSILKYIRHKHGQMAFEKCREEWKVILEKYNASTK